MVNELIDKIRVCTDKVLPLISAICDKIGLAEIVDKQTGATQNERIVSTGNIIKAIAMNIVAGREPVYRLEEFYRYTDTEKMFGEGIKAGHITDDTVARALDEMVNKDGNWVRHCQLDENLKRLIILAGFDPYIYINGHKKV